MLWRLYGACSHGVMGKIAYLTDIVTDSHLLYKDIKPQRPLLHKCYTKNVNGKLCGRKNYGIYVTYHINAVQKEP